MMYSDHLTTTDKCHGDRTPVQITKNAQQINLFVRFIKKYY